MQMILEAERSESLQDKEAACFKQGSKFARQAFARRDFARLAGFKEVRLPISLVGWGTWPGMK